KNDEAPVSDMDHATVSPAASDGAVNQAWLPIETAPKGRKVIVSVQNGRNRPPITMMGRYYPRGTFEVAEGYEGEDWAVDIDGISYMPEGWYEECMVEDAPAHNINPAYWMPLPPPPGSGDRET